MIQSVFLFIFREIEGPENNPKFPQTDVMFHLIANFRVDMRERDQSNRILH